MDWTYHYMHILTNITVNLVLSSTGLFNDISTGLLRLSRHFEIIKIYVLECFRNIFAFMKIVCFRSVDLPIV